MGNEDGGCGPVRLSHGSPAYPASLARYLHSNAPASLAILGNPHVIRQKKLALFCSVRCPGELIVRTYDLARVLRDAGATVIGGFQSPMEKECLDLLLRGTQPVIVCPARSLDNMRLPSAWKKPLLEGRLLLFSPFEAQVKRPTAELARARNELVAALADEVVIAYADPGGKTEAFAQKVLAWGKQVLTLESTYNAGLVALGAKPVKPERVPEFL